MIDPHWSVIDLDPRTWRNLGRFIDPGLYIRTAQPGERGLFVLHDRGRAVRVVDTQSGVRRDLAIDSFDDPRILAHTLFESGEWDRVHVIDKQHLANVARQAQTIANRELTLDAYYHAVYELMWKNPLGYVSLPPHPGHWQGWTYTGIKEFVARLPDPTSLALGVLDERGEIAIGLILELRGGLIRRVTTFEALQFDAPLTLSAEGFERLWSSVAQRFAPVGGILLCDQPAFDGWIEAKDKMAYLREAAGRHAAFWRVELK